MITFGNESLQISNNLNPKKLDEHELLKKKYRKLESENRALKSIIEEMMGLSENLKISFKNTESMYITISDSIRNVLNGKHYNSGMALSTDNLLKSQNIGSQENLINLNQGNNFNFFASQSIADLNKIPNVNPSLNIDNKNNPQININLNSNTNITNIYNNGSTNEVTNSNNKIINQNEEKNENIIVNSFNDELNKENKENVNIKKENKEEKRVKIIEDTLNNSQNNQNSNNNSPRKVSSLRNSFEKDVVLTLGEDLHNKKIFENNNKERENLNIIDLNISGKQDYKANLENARKSLNNNNAIESQNNYIIDGTKISDKEFSEKINISNLNKDNNNELEKIDQKNAKIIVNNNNSNENSTKESNKTSSNASNQNKNEIKEKIYASETNLEVEFENLTKIILENLKKDKSSEESMNKLADNLYELQKKYLQIKYEKEEYEKVNLEILKTLKQAEDRYNHIYSKYEELNKYIDILYISIHSILVLSDNSNEKTHTIKCEPVPSYLRFINNIIN